MNRNPLTLLIVGAILVVVFASWLFSFQVPATKVAVVTTFGRPTTPITEAGLHFRLPPPIQRVWKFDNRVQNFEDKLSEGLTRDSFNVLTSVFVGWKITEPTDFYPKFAGTADPIAEAEKSLERVLSNVKNAVVGKHPLSDFVSANDGGTNFLGIENEILQAVRAQVGANRYGIGVEFLGFKKLQLPEQVTKDVFDRMQAERKVLATHSQKEGEAEAQKIRSEAERKTAETLATANSEATRIKGLAEAEAAKSLAVFQQQPDLAKFIFSLDALEAALKEKSTLVFDRHTPPFDLLAGVSSNLLSAPAAAPSGSATNLTTK
jgi:membrane protease subunit HflC